MVSNAEPGYYEDGNFGVRIENVLIVNEAEAKYNYGEKGYLAFEHITWVSNDLFLVSQAMVTVAMWCIHINRMGMWSLLQSCSSSDLAFGCYLIICRHLTKQSLWNSLFSLRLRKSGLMSTMLHVGRSLAPYWQALIWSGYTRLQSHSPAKQLLLHVTCQKIVEGNSTE